MPHKTFDTKDGCVADSINELLAEEDVFHPLKGDTVGRAVLRREFVRAIKVVFENGLEVEGYCSNISTNGIELITHEAFLIHGKAIIEIQSLNQLADYRLVAECRWCKDIGVGGLVSGWSFISLL